MYSDLKAMAGNEEGLQMQVLELRAKKNEQESMIQDLQGNLQTQQLRAQSI
jgi:hypothetical protein